MASILIIDDNDAVRTALEVLLSLQGHRVLAASLPDEGLRLLAKEQVDLVLQDMNFRKEATSGEEGVGLFHAIRERYPTVPIVLLTAWTHLETAVELVKAGAADYVAKPWDDARLLTTIRNLLELRRLSVEQDRAARRRAESRAALAQKFDLVRTRVRERADARCGHEGYAHCRRRRAGAHHRAERLGQGSAGRDHPGELDSARRSVHQGQRRRVAEGSDGGRAVRRRSRRIHGRDQSAPGTFRSGRRRHAVPRRDRQSLAGRSGEAAACAADRRVRAPGQQHARVA